MSDKLINDKKVNDWLVLSKKFNQSWEYLRYL